MNIKSLTGGGMYEILSKIEIFVHQNTIQTTGQKQHKTWRFECYSSWVHTNMKQRETEKQFENI